MFKSSGRTSSDYVTGIEDWKQGMRHLADASNTDLEVILINLQTAAIYTPTPSSEFVAHHLAHIFLRTKRGLTINSSVAYSDRLIRELRKTDEEAKRNRLARGDIR